MARLRCALGLAIAWFSALSPSVARADGLLGSTYYEVGPIYASGGIVFPGGNEAISASGIHIYERNGLGGKFISTAVVAFILAAGKSDTEYPSRARSSSARRAGAWAPSSGSATRARAASTR